MADTTPEQDRGALAAELALGLLEGEDRAAALRLCLSDRDFADAVEAWNVRLAPLFDEIAGAAPPQRVWNAVEARIDARRTDGTARSLKLWRALALGSGAIAASLALFIAVNQPPAPAPAPQFAVAQLLDPAGSPVVTAAFDAGRGILRLRSGPIETASLAPELWVIPADGVPRSLGLIASSGTSDVRIDPSLHATMREGATLAITAEDRASAPHAAPSSTPILAGKISAI